MDMPDRENLAQLLRAQEQAFAVLASALGDIVGHDRLADAIRGRLAVQEGDAHGGEDQLLAAAMLLRALQSLQAPPSPSAPSDKT